jgi:formylglycine-generating enzyme required for sulfatase activity
MVLIRISPGEFEMGSPVNEEGRNQNERPHRVRLTHFFMMGEREVSQAQWKTLMGDKHRSSVPGDDLPVDRVTWDQADQFCKTLSKNEGRVYRLPTEAEWEYACRAGKQEPYATGRQLDPKHASFAVGNARQRRPMPVGSLAPNANGIRDMHGNVAEWCQDWYDEYPGQLVTDPVGPAGGVFRVVRGGRYVDGAEGCRSARRDKATPGAAMMGYGFRVVLVSGWDNPGR